MQRYFISLAYKGTNYHGWQVQPNAISVQQVINERMSTLLKENINVTGAGRTDTGVHAKYFVMHFDSKNMKLDQNFIGKMNNFLPPDIAFFNIKKVNTYANTRFDATSRTYKYFINTQKDPFSNDSVWLYKYKLDFDAMNQAAQTLFKYNDFTSFSKLHTQVQTNNCRIMEAYWQFYDESKLVFTIKADRFLRNMVRAIVGTLLEVGRKKIRISDFETIILEKERSKAGVSVPARGLFLWNIQYPNDIYTVSNIDDF